MSGSAIAAIKSQIISAGTSAKQTPRKAATPSSWGRLFGAGVGMGGFRFWAMTCR